MKRQNSCSGKGLLEVNWAEGKAVFTEQKKVGKEVIEIPYDFFKLIEEFNSKHVSFMIKEEDEIEPIDDENVSRGTNSDNFFDEE